METASAITAATSTDFTTAPRSVSQRMSGTSYVPRFAVTGTARGLASPRRLGRRCDRPTLSALADPTRRAIVDRPSAGELTVTELAEPFEMSLPANSRHLKVLQQAGLVRQRRDAQRRYCQLDGQPVGRDGGVGRALSKLLGRQL